MDPMVATLIFHVTLTGLQEYNTYEIRVRAVNAEGSGPINCRGSFGEAPPISTKFIDSIWGVPELFLF